MQKTFWTILGALKEKTTRMTLDAVAKNTFADLPEGLLEGQGKAQG